MSDNWQPGDLALCVSLRHPAYSNTSSKLRVGAIYTVVKVGRVLARIDDFGLGLAEVQPNISGRGYPSKMFRKINPLTEPERASYLADLDEPVRVPTA